MEHIDFQKFSSFLYSGLLCDVMDQMGYPNQCFSKEFQPLTQDMKLFGRAFTAVMQEIFEPVEKPLVNQTKAIAAMGANEVYVLKTCGAYNAGVWGEILSTAARMNGAVGAVIDGMSRDSDNIIKMGYPTFSRGHLPTTAKNRAEIVAWQVPVVIDGVKVAPGDLIFGDLDGVCVIPREIEDAVLQECLDLEERENVIRNKILAGVNIVDAFFEIGAL